MGELMCQRCGLLTDDPDETNRCLGCDEVFCDNCYDTRLGDGCQCHDTPTEPDEADLVTDDHVHFYASGKLELTVPADASTRQMWAEIDAWVGREQWYPNVWFVSDHGNAHRMERPELAPPVKEEIDLGVYGIRVTLTTVDGETGGVICSDLHEDDREDVAYSANMSGVESLILAHACAGVDIKSLAYVRGIETAVEAITNNADDMEET